MRALRGPILAAAIGATFAVLAGESGVAASPCDLDFKCVWRGRSVFDAEMSFPDGVSFVPSAHYRPHGRGWPTFAEMPEGCPYRYIMLTMDRINYPGIPDPNWTYGAIFIYGANL